MSAIHSSKYWAPCTFGGDRPCAMHPEKPSDGNNLWSPEELRAIEVENVTSGLARLVREIREAGPGNTPERKWSPWLADAEEALSVAKRLGIHV